MVNLVPEMTSQSEIVFDLGGGGAADHSSHMFERIAGMAKDVETAFPADVVIHDRHLLMHLGLLYYFHSHFVQERNNLCRIFTHISLAVLAYRLCVEAHSDAPGCQSLYPGNERATAFDCDKWTDN